MCQAVRFYGLTYSTTTIALFTKVFATDVTGQHQKFKRRYQHLTPAMKMGLTSTQLKWQDLILAPIPEKAHEFSTSTVL